MYRNPVAILTHGVVERVIPNDYVEVRLDGELRICFAAPSLRRSGVTMQEGDRVTVRTEEGGPFRGEIVRVRPAGVEPAPKLEKPQAASLITRAPSGLKPHDHRLDRTTRPGWQTGAECMPQVGDEVHCTAGPATVLRVLGKTGDGSRLLELRIPGQPRAAFFAAASNVLLPPDEMAEQQAPDAVAAQ
jgi:translation initiation factor IF-1